MSEIEDLGDILGNHTERDMNSGMLKLSIPMVKSHSVTDLKTDYDNL